MANDEILNAKQVAEYLKLSRAQTYRVILKIPHIRMGRSVRVRREVLEAWVKSQTVLPRI